MAAQTRTATMNARSFRLTVLVLSAALLGACATRQAPVYEESPTWAGQRAGYQYGVVRSIDTVASRESTTGAGALVGGLVGALVGRQMGSAGNGRTAGTMIGAIGGAVIGNEVEHENTRPAARYRVLVELDGGQTRSFNLAQLGDLHPGDRVVVDGQGLRRY